METQSLVMNMIPREDLLIERAILEPHGYRIEQGAGSSVEELIAQARTAHALIGSHQPYTRRVFQELTLLKIVALIGVGHDTVDLQAANDHGVRVTNVPDLITDPVADHTLALILALIRQVPQGFDRVIRGGWESQMWKWAPNVSKLSCLTAGIIGFGRTGQAVAKRLKAFGTRIVALDPYLKQLEDPDVTRVGSLRELLPAVDILCLHAFLSPETANMIGEPELRSMKRTAILVNASRGALVDEKALYTALCEGWIAGAALDVMEPEPPGDNPLLKSDRVIITPHVAFYSRESLREQRQRTAEEVVRALQGLPALHPLTRA